MVASSCNFLPTFWDNLSGPIFKERIGCHETSVINYHYSLRNNPAESSSQILRGNPIAERHVSGLVNYIFMKYVSREIYGLIQRLEYVPDSKGMVPGFKSLFNRLSEHGRFEERIVKNNRDIVRRRGGILIVATPR